ncbi:uncharacterized protein LOC34622901 [Cyclospora cayetanensis]|uniref:Uncharacterized protein LOC34622901 n=1 Tax=Cyclospora cayetanensis TaxID=88456 RepID=A0A6P6S125_9EIME|nr:uncharacterized protein LOC34622901 [Cyclospora cayetanensis]
MKSNAVVLATACLLVRTGATDVLQGPEFIDTLLPEIAHVFGVTSTQHTTLEEMNLRAEDVYVLPRAPKVEDCLSALNGIPMTQQAKPFSDSASMLDVKPYESAQLKIAEARAAELAASVAPVVSVAPKSKYYKSSISSMEIAPGAYRSTFYVIFQAVMYLILVPGALRGIRYGRITDVKTMLSNTVFFVCYSVGVVIFQNVLAVRALFALPLSVAFGLYAMRHTLRSMDSVEHLQSTQDNLPYSQGMGKEPLAWLMCIEMYCVLLANFSYHFVSCFVPYVYGLAGLVTSNIIVAGFVYLAYLGAVAYLLYLKIKADPESRKVQSRIVTFNCAYVVASGISFYTNVLAVYRNIGDFVALEPAVFFTATRIFELNLGTAIMIIALLVIWGVGYHEQNQMDERGKNVSTMSSVSLSTEDESRRALEEALNEMQTGVDM